MASLTKFYTEEKLKGRLTPVGKKFSEQLFLGSDFPNVVFFVQENTTLSEARIATQKSANLKEKLIEKTYEKIPFMENPVNHKRMLSIHTSKEIYLTLLAFDDSLPIFESIKNFKINANSLIYLSREVLGFVKIDSKQIRFALGPSNVEDLGQIISSINKLKPISVNCQIDNLRSLGFSDLKAWNDASSDHIYIGRRPPVFVKNVRVSIKKSELAASKELLAPHISDEVFEVEYEKNLKKSIEM
jgi:hypothetical protein